MYRTRRKGTKSFFISFISPKKNNNKQRGEPCTEGETMDLGVQEKKSPLGETLGKIIIKQDQTLLF